MSIKSDECSIELCSKPVVSYMGTTGCHMCVEHTSAFCVKDKSQFPCAKHQPRYCALPLHPRCPFLRDKP